MRKFVVLATLTSYMAVMFGSPHHLLPVPYRALPPEPMTVTTQI